MKRLHKANLARAFGGNVESNTRPLHSTLAAAPLGDEIHGHGLSFVVNCHREGKYLPDFEVVEMANLGSVHEDVRLAECALELWRIEKAILLLGVERLDGCRKAPVFVERAAAADGGITRREVDSHRLALRIHDNCERVRLPNFEVGEAAELTGVHEDVRLAEGRSQLLTKEEAISFLCVERLDGRPEAHTCKARHRGVGRYRAARRLLNWRRCRRRAAATAALAPIRLLPIVAAAPIAGFAAAFAPPVLLRVVGLAAPFAPPVLLRVLGDLATGLTPPSLLRVVGDLATALFPVRGASVLGGSWGGSRHRLVLAAEGRARLEEGARPEVGWRQVVGLRLALIQEDHEGEFGACGEGPRRVATPRRFLDAEEKVLAKRVCDLLGMYEAVTSIGAERLHPPGVPGLEYPRISVDDIWHCPIHERLQHRHAVLKQTLEGLEEILVAARRECAKGMVHLVPALQTWQAPRSRRHASVGA
mmetsp:Transcript_101381/g.285991  ORF Transcript_101381/g.285991 Transcript_101381/m.285991 type:complete len:476 (+) Transcript_101381:2-1429(+)